jgi:uncharacterized protein GlcG (DUF336 family)
MQLARIGAAACGALMLVSGIAFSQAPQYGPDITLDQARKAIAAGQAEARKNNWPVAIAVVDNHGFLVAFEKMDNTQTASVQIAVDKGVSAAMFRRPTKVFQDLLAKGGEGWRLPSLRGASMVDGGVPIVIGGKIVGGIGVSGVASHEDAVVAKAGADALR